VREKTDVTILMCMWVVCCRLVQFTAGALVIKREKTNII
jgi:hypothetical protein